MQSSIGVALLGLILMATNAMAQTTQGAATPRMVPAVDLTKWESIEAQHPAGAALHPFFSADQNRAKIESTGMSRKDYLQLIAGNVDFWKQHQDQDGAIIDPYQHAEMQYSTPAFALASAVLVAEAGRNDLLDHSIRATTFALSALANGTTANNHADFYIPMLIHARRILKGRVEPAVAANWDALLKGLVPENTYRDIDGNGNWNIVNLSGDSMRGKDGLVAADQSEARIAYVERCLDRQTRNFSKFGMYSDPNVPLAYDAFPRLWLEDMMADGAYDGAHKELLQSFLALGGASTLLLLSPSGEWACGGRSAHHQWNEAEVAVICECNANKWKAAGRQDVAGAFKRAAHLAYRSMKRWHRPSGEMWIVKNFADPSERFGYEGYSFHSQYNLLPMAMLAIAYLRADESIAEQPIPSEAGGYVFDLRDTFHKICAAAGGYYVLIDTHADPHYNATGLQRVHRAGVALSPLSDSSAPQRGFGPANAQDRASITPCIQWKDGAEWIGLADFVLAESPALDSRAMEKMPDLKTAQQSAERVSFTLIYDTQGPGARDVEQTYTLSKDGVSCTEKIAGDAAATRFIFPALVSDGANDTDVNVENSSVTITRKGGAMTFTLEQPRGVKLAIDGPEYATHNGYVRAVIGELPAGTTQATWSLKLTPSGEMK